MTTMNIVHMRVKPGLESEFMAINRAFDSTSLAGSRNFWVVKTGERDFCVIGEWQSMGDMVNARPAMIANLDLLRPVLENLGGGRGVTEPWSGDVSLHQRASGSSDNAL